jgi:stearoyl-CoA desaturase (Delta-9 desaturase)
MSSDAKAPEGTPLIDGTKDYKPLRGKGYDLKKPHITETPITWGNWYKHVNWLNVTFIIGVPLAGCVAAYWTPLHLYTAIFAVIYYFNTGLGITAGKSHNQRTCSESVNLLNMVN